MDKDGYHSTGVMVENLEPGEMKKIKVDGKIIVLTAVNDQIFAFDGTCPHGAASLANGSLSGGKISCPDHGYCFDIRSGRILWPEDELYLLKKYIVKVDTRHIKIRPDNG